MVSPEPYPVMPASVSTRTRVASKCRRGTGSHAASKGGSSTSRIRSRRIVVIFTTNGLSLVTQSRQRFLPGLLSGI
jgi:hypothetical protein